MASPRSKTALDNHRKTVITRIINIRRVVERDFANLESWFSETTRRISQTSKSVRNELGAAREILMKYQQRIDEEDENELRRALVEGKKEDYSFLFDDDDDFSIYNSPSTRLHNSTETLVATLKRNQELRLENQQEEEKLKSLQMANTQMEVRKSREKCRNPRRGESSTGGKPTT